MIYGIIIMKISALSENITVSSSPAGIQSQQAPKFGRNPKVLEDDKIEETTAGCVASVAQPMGGMQKRKGSGALLKGISTSKKYANSATVKEEEIKEQDVIINPTMRNGPKPGFHNRMDHEGDTVKNSLHTIIRVSKALNDRIDNHTQFPEWVSEKIGAIKSNMVTVMDYIISQQERGDNHVIDEFAMGEEDMAEGLRNPKDNPCWKGYHPVGTKKKGGRTVPNCVPKANEAANPAQQAAIAINMKKHHKKPKSMTEGNKMELYGLHVGDTVKADVNGHRVQGDIIDIFPEEMQVELLLRGPHAGKTVTVDVRDTEYIDEQGLSESVADKQKISKYEKLALAANKAGDDAKCKQYQEKIQALKQKMSQGVAEDEISALKTIRGPHGKLNVDRSEKGVTKVKRQHWASSHPQTGNSSSGIGVPQSTRFSKVGSEKEAHRRYPRLDRDDIDMTESTEDIASAKERLAYLEKIFDPSYEYSDDHSVWKQHNEIRQEMNHLKKIIGHGEQNVEEESKGLWANIHAKRERIKHGSGERMRKPGSKGAPTADALRKSAK